jgi:hypothetical protein
MSIHDRRRDLRGRSDPKRFGWQVRRHQAETENIGRAVTNLMLVKVAEFRRSCNPAKKT